MGSKSQAGFSPLHILLVLVVLGAIGLVGWKVYDANKSKKTTTSPTVSQSVTTKEEPKKVAPTIPEGFVAYENKELGLKFAHPKVWGEVKDVSNGEVIFSAHFSNLKDNDNPINGKNISIFANTGKQDFTVGGRGGALWDCIGYTQTGSTYFCQGIAKGPEGITNRGTEIKNPQVIKAVNSDVLAYTYTFFSDDMFNITANLKRSYYAVVLVTNDSNQELKNLLKQVAATIEVL